MYVTREFVEKLSGRFLVIIRLPYYGSKFSHFVEMVNMAKKDFDNLQDSEVVIVHYGGEVHRRTFGIEFEVDKIPPNGYTQIEQTERRL